jgi:hypothetical protein
VEQGLESDRERTRARPTNCVVLLLKSNRQPFSLRKLFLEDQELEAALCPGDFRASGWSSPEMQMPELIPADFLSVADYLDKFCCITTPNRQFWHSFSLNLFNPHLHPRRHEFF